MSAIKILACTGGIGSGKSYVAKIFGKLGYPVYYSDERAKQLYDTDELLLSQMVDLLGSDILQNGKLNRAVVAAKIFSNRSLLEKVEQIVHPAVLRDFLKWKSEQEKNLEKGCNFVIFESAIILEKPVFKELSFKVLNVVAPVQERIERVMARDGVTKEQVLERMSKQWSDEDRAAFSHYTISSGSKQAVLPQIVDVINKMNLEN